MTKSEEKCWVSVKLHRTDDGRIRLAVHPPRFASLIVKDIDDVTIEGIHDEGYEEEFGGPLLPATCFVETEGDPCVWTSAQIS